MPIDLKRVLAEVKKDLDTEKFQSVETTVIGDAKGYLAVTKNWNFVVAEFGIEEQGFPPGSKGYDGTAHKAGTIIHLTRELAELAFKKADRHARAN